MITTRTSIFYRLTLVALVLFFSPAHSDEVDDDLHEIAEITQDIKQNGPADVQCLPTSAIREAASSFVYGQRTGVTSAAVLSRLGGVERATVEALRGEIAASGVQVCQ